VVLRRAGALATIDPLGAQVVARRPVCSLPRGLAYDAAADRLHVACAGGELVTLAPTGDAPLRTVRLPRDLRDVVVDGSRLLVTRFRSAEVLEVSADGALGSTTRLPWFVSTSLREGQPFAPAVAWRAVALPAGGAVVAHQRGMNGALTEKPGGYGGTSSGFDPCASIVHSAVSLVRPGTRPVAGPPMSSFVLPVDLAVSPDGKRVAVVAAGNSRPGAGSRLFVTEVAGVTDEWTGTCSDDGVHGPRPGISCVADSGAAGSATGQTCYPDLPAVFEPVSVAFTASGQVLVQGREPATLAVSVPGKTLAYNLELKLVGLSSESRADTGHQVFHGDSGAGMACASGHPEGREDGRVWDFTCGGSRRTQSLAGGVSSTEPLHWAGELRDFSHLMEEVFMGRMAGPRLTGEQVGATRRWVDSLPPLPPSRAAGDPQVERGRAIFADPNVGCAAAGCHTGARFTSNLSVAVGTGGVFQVPSLTGVGWREPYLHSGCATTLADRFGKTPCGGGDAHGRTSGLAPSALGDLLAYLDSL
jgi:hypothetical protein